MDDKLAERIAIALEQIALELASPRIFEGIRPIEPEAVTAEPVVNRPAPTFAPIGGWNCPVHGGHRIVPAGFSQRTGKAYDAFMACAARGCNEKPPRAIPPSVAARALP